ncbi:MAG TPA: hypothetical protein VMW35_01000 [Myxococcota bacterium]|jgi:hypothetical protein|nr:hypothetical protein [Myxococcota bacterium]
MHASSPPRPIVSARALAALAVVMVLGFCLGAARADTATPSSAAVPRGFRDRIDLGPRALDVAVDVASPGAGSTSLSGEGRVETDLVLGTRLVVHQPYKVSLDGGSPLSAPRIEARRDVRLGPDTVGSLGLSTEPFVHAASPRAETRLEHRLTATSRVSLALDLGELQRARPVGATLRFERRF